MSVRDGLLVLLAAAPRHGYQLKAELEQTSTSERPLNVGQIYTTLDRLQRDGLVAALDDEADGDGDAARRRRFTVTDAGRAVARSWLLEAPADLTGRDEVVTRVLLALASDTVDPLAVIDAQRQSVLARLQAKRRALRESGELVERAAIDAVAARLEATVAWLDRTEAALRATPGGS